MTMTAVEWLIEQLQAPCRGIPSHIIEQSLQMEQEQRGYTEEQVMEAMVQISDYYAENFGKKLNGHKKALEIIQSLKQHKQ